MGVVMLLLLVTGGILVITVVVGVVIITKATKQDEENVLLKTENYGTNTEDEKVKRIEVKDNLEEAMLCSDVEIEKAEAEIMKACEETLDLSEVKELNKYFSIADEEPAETNSIQEEEAIKAIQSQAKELNRYAAANIENNVNSNNHSILEETATTRDLKKKFYLFKIFGNRKSSP